MINEIVMNITNAIKKANEADVLWSVSLFFTCIDLISKDEFFVSFWEEEENWASVSFKDVVVGYVWRKHPLILVDSGYEDRIKLCLKEYQFISFIAVKSLYETELSIDDGILKDEIDLHFNKDAFSAEEFWFQTNSI